jgi:uncharacterized membrane protein
LQHGFDNSEENVMTRLMALPPVFATEPSAGLWANPIEGLIVSVATIIMAIGVAIVIWGAYSSVLRLITLETASARLRLPSTDTAPVRLLFASYLLHGLDFLIAGGVIKTLAVSDWHQAAVLGGIALVRVLLGLGVKWEAGSAPVEASPPTAAQNGALPGNHLPEPSTLGGKKLTEDLTARAGHAAQ